MAKAQKQEASTNEENKITVRMHNHVVIMDRFTTWLGLSKNRSSSMGDPKTLQESVEYVEYLLASRPVIEAINKMVTGKTEPAPEKTEDPAAADDQTGPD